MNLVHELVEYWRDTIRPELIEHYEKELAALKPQGEPVLWIVNGVVVKSELLYGYTGPLYTSAPTIPEGYVLVPLYPSNNMMESARLATESEGIVTSTWLRRAVWDAMIVAAIKEAMIAAAPKPKEPE
jgi:hypothetical protein